MSVVNSGAGGVNGGYGGDEGEEIGRQEMEKFEVADGEATRVVIALSRVVSGPGRTFENSGVGRVAAEEKMRSGEMIKGAQ